MGGFSGISACGQIALLEEVAPTRMVVRGALSLLEIFQGCLCGAPAVHHGDDAARTVRSDIVQNDCEGGAGIVVCQKKSVHKFASKREDLQSESVVRASPRKRWKSEKAISVEIAFFKSAA